MAANNFVANTSLQKQLYLEQAWKESLQDAFFAKFWRFPTAGESSHIGMESKVAVMESDANMPIFVKRRLDDNFRTAGYRWATPYTLMIMKYLGPLEIRYEFQSGIPIHPSGKISSVISEL